MWPWCIIHHKLTQKRRICYAFYKYKYKYKTNKENTNMRQNNNTTKSQNSKITNWPQYEKALRKRGDCFTILDDAIKNGAFDVPSRTYERGRPRIYSDELIVLILTIHELYHQPLRQAILFTWRIMVALGKYAKLPDHSTVSRRAAELNINILPDDYALYHNNNLTLLVDSSGFELSGIGNWFSDKHDVCAIRIWQETHIIIDYDTRMILGVIDTKNHVHDNTQLLPLIIEAEKNLTRVGANQKLECIIGDGAYEAKGNNKMAKNFGASFIAPPQKNATYHYNLKDGKLIDVPGWEERNQVIRAIMRAGCIENWKKQVGYHRRSLVENAFYRLKNTFGDRMTMRTEKNRHTEQLIRIKILNMFTTYGLPKYT